MGVRVPPRPLSLKARSSRFGAGFSLERAGPLHTPRYPNRQRTLDESQCVAGSTPARGIPPRTRSACVCALGSRLGVPTGRGCRLRTGTLWVRTPPEAFPSPAVRFAPPGRHSTPTFLSGLGSLMWIISTPESPLQHQGEREVGWGGAKKRWTIFEKSRNNLEGPLR